MTPKEIAEKIENAIEGATAGPWEVYVETVPSRYDAAYELSEQIQGTDPFVGKLFMLTANGKCPAETGCGPTSEGNANYLVACNPENMRAILADYKRQSEYTAELEAQVAYYIREADRQYELLDEARELADATIDCLITDVTMQGPRVTGVNGSAARRTSEMARSFLSKLEAHQ